MTERKNRNIYQYLCSCKFVVIALIYWYLQALLHMQYTCALYQVLCAFWGTFIGFNAASDFILFYRHELISSFHYNMWITINDTGLGIYETVSRFITSIFFVSWYLEGTSILPEVLSVPHVPGCRVTDHLPPISGFCQHGIYPEVRKHLVESNWYKEILCCSEYISLVPSL